MALSLEDPLSTSLYNVGLSQLQPWDPTQEAARKDKAWGETQQKLGERYARAGLTGSSQELGDFANTAKNFELDWGERAPKQRAEAISSVLPIHNFRRSVSNDMTSEAQAATQLATNKKAAQTALWGSLLGASGLPTTLAKALFGTSTPASSGWQQGGLIPKGISALYNYLSGSGDIAGSGFSTDQLNALDPAIDWTEVADWLNNYDYLNNALDVGGVSDAADVLGGLSLSDLTGYF